MTGKEFLLHHAHLAACWLSNVTDVTRSAQLHMRSFSGDDDENAGKSRRAVNKPVTQLAHPLRVAKGRVPSERELPARSFTGANYTSTEGTDTSTREFRARACVL